MSNPCLPRNKNVIFITPEELSKLPAESPVYVLSTEGKQGDIVRPLLSTISPNNAASCCASVSMYTPTTSASSGLSIPSMMYPPPSTFPTSSGVVSLPYNCLPSVPTFISGGQPSTTLACYPTAVGAPFTYPLNFSCMSSFSMARPYGPPWMQLQPRETSTIPSLGTAGLPSPASFLPSIPIPPTLPASQLSGTPPAWGHFNLSHPPPALPPVTLPTLKVPVTVVTADSQPARSTPTADSLRKEKYSSLRTSSRSSGGDIKFEETVSSPNQKRPELQRYTRLVCAPAPDHFVLCSETGCHYATERLIALEDRFAYEILGRRSRVTADQPERKPLDRQAWHESKCKQKLRKGVEPDLKHTCTDAGFTEATVDTQILEQDAFSDMSFDSDDLSNVTSLLSDGGSTHTDFKRMRANSTSNFSSFTSPQAKTNEGKFSARMRSRKKRKSRKALQHPDDQGEVSPTDDPHGLGGKSQSPIACLPVGGHSIGQRSIRQQREVAYKLSHPNRLHPDIWHNEPHEFNDGPACACKPKYRIGPLHNQYEGEMLIPSCVQESNNRDRLYHYRVLVSPTTNFVQPNPTVISYKDHDYTFDGFSIFLHYKLDNLPPCQILRFNLLYDMFPVEEDFPELFTVRALDMLTEYIYVELLELLDLSWRPFGVTEGCPVVHLMPRFVRTLSSETPNGENMVIGEILPVNVVLEYLLEEALKPVIDVMELSSVQRYNSAQWSKYIAPLRGTLTTFPGKKPAAIRIDQLDRRSLAGEPADGVLIYPLIVHMTYTPMKLSLTREPKYKCVLKNFMKLQYLMMNKPRITPADRSQLTQLANALENMEHSGVHRREITVELSSEGFYRTGIRPDVSQYAINLVSLVSHLRFHKSLESLETRLGYQFKDKSLLHQALTHPSYRRTNFGTNQDHFQNSLVSCGPRILEYGDKLQLYKAWRKKGLTKMIQVMSVLPKMHEERSNIYGNERLEFLGDAVIEVISSIHLFFMFPDLPEGNLDAYRQAIVQNQHLAELAVRLGIHKFLLYTHSVDFCYDSTFIYARSDAYEALMAAITLDAGLDEVDRIFGAVLFGDEPRIHRVWVKIPPHPLQAQFPDGDRSWAVNVPMLKKLTTLEDNLGITFKHLRVLARSMTIRKTGFNFYTLGDNQRLEFLGDSLLKYVSTNYLFRHFPRHHEGHLSLLKNSLVNKYTQAAVCSELGLDQYVIRREDNSLDKVNTDNPTDRSLASTLKSGKASASAPSQNVKYRADLLEAFIGALFVDKDLVWVERFCQVCFWPRLVEFILKQEWNDAKSKLQQCCLTFRSLHEDPEIAHYKVLEHSGPTNQRTYLVGVYFRGQRLATGSGRSVQQAQMEAAKQALEIHQDTFRQLDFQRSVISRRYKQPYIDKMLDHVQNWDERLVDYFVSDCNEASCVSPSPGVVRPASRSKSANDFVDLLQTDRHHDACTDRSARGSAKNNDRSRSRLQCNDRAMGSARFGWEMEEGEIDDDDEDDTNADGSHIYFSSDSNSELMDMDSDKEPDNEPTVTLPSGTLADLFRGRKAK
ncbi:hypothetical protein P879_04946 [Paragonimus westermani]|uniref:Uncharacterized protein n=1 Tax=Paragonimus westermani TaxID=34504 RepID=A0A8T0DIN1_9TREM|nr:hypothetical protein P879_04946 [Paragonimus westermani]